ncbi:MAG TPA: type VI secretion system-associated FHA domain protein [Limnobacter sp.]|uniref:type VI secretion system-associated FHA domain protein n=1 Tax=Limnobacter sp. TaxID=2003368 RepID=UPI002EDAB447
MPLEYEFRVVTDAPSMGVDSPLATPLVLPVGPGSGVLGRAPNCRYSIPDPSRVISREHALIERHQDRVYWTPRGSNPTQRHGEVLQVGKRHLLEPGDVLELGPYQVHFIQREAMPAVVWSLQPSAPDESAWLHDPLEKGTWSIDAVLGAGDVSMSAPPADASLSLPLRTPVQSHHLWLDDLELPKSVQPPAQPPVQQRVTREPMPAPAPMSTVDWVEALGLGFVEPWNETHTERLKVVIHQSLALLLSLLEARRLMRQELGGHQTTIRARSNNPLKVAVSVPQALSNLLEPDPAAHLPADQAFEELSSDLLSESGHLLNAIRQLMGKLDQHLAPRHIERQLERMSGITLPIGVHRKARMWDLYCQQFQHLRGERSLPFATLLEDALRDPPQPQQDG